MASPPHPVSSAYAKQRGGGAGRLGGRASGPGSWERRERSFWGSLHVEGGGRGGGGACWPLAAVTPPPLLRRVGEGGTDPNFRRQDGKGTLLFLQGFSARACTFPYVRLGFPRGRASRPPRPAPNPHTCSLSEGEGDVVPALSPWPLPSREGTLAPSPAAHPPVAACQGGRGSLPEPSVPHETRPGPRRPVPLVRSARLRSQRNPKSIITLKSLICLNNPL